MHFTHSNIRIIPQTVRRHGDSRLGSWPRDVSSTPDHSQTWSSRDLGLGLGMSQDCILKVLILVLNTKVLVLVPKVSALDLRLGLGIVF